MSSTYTTKITNKWSGEHAKYSGQINGRVEILDEAGEPTDVIDGGQFSGEIEGDTDHYRMHGEMTEFSLSGSAMIFVDGISMSAASMVGLGYAGPNPPQGYQGPGSAVWGGTGTPDTRGDAPGKNDRPAHGTSGSGGGSSGGDGPVSATMQERIELASGRDRPEDVTVLESGAELKDALESIPDNYSRDYRYVMPDGVHDVPGGTIQATFRPDKPRYNVVVVGNPENPWTCDVRGNINFISNAKDEHQRFEGMAWGRTQLVGPFFLRNMGFSDCHRKQHSSFGGKPTGGRIQNSDVGKPGNPDSWGMCLFGGGENHVDHGTVVRGENAAISVRNTATVHVSDQATLDAPTEVEDRSDVRTFVAGREF